MNLKPIVGLLNLSRLPAQALPEFITETHKNPDLAAHGCEPMPSLPWVH